MTGDNDCYEDYLKLNQGVFLKDDYTITKFKKMADSFKYLSCGHENDYILVRKEKLKAKSVGLTLKNIFTAIYCSIGLGVFFALEGHSADIA